MTEGSGRGRDREKLEKWGRTRFNSCAMYEHINARPLMRTRTKWFVTAKR